MKKFFFGLFYLVFLVSPVNAQDDSDNYRFLVNYIDCLQKLETAVSVRVLDLSGPELSTNLSEQLRYLDEAKTILNPWLGPLEQASLEGQDLNTKMKEAMAQMSLINLTALPIYQSISLMQSRLTERNTDIRNATEDQRPVLLQKYALENSSDWSTFFTATENVLWLVMARPKDEISAGKIPFVISFEERQSLLAHLEKSFGYKFRLYENLSQQHEEGTITDSQFKISVPLYSALYLSYILIIDTYEEDKKAKSMKDPFIFPRFKRIMMSSPQK